MTRRALGRCLTPEHDDRSRLPQYAARRAVRLVSVLHEHRGPVLDQGNLGACTGYAAAQLLNCARHVDARGGTLLDARCADALYSRATSRDWYPGAWPGIDTGSSGLAAAKAAKDLDLIPRYGHALGLQHTLAALALDPVSIGIPWHPSMDEPGPDGLLTVDTDVEAEGGHQLVGIGLDVERQMVRLLNSWGPSWGDAGTALIRWSDLGRLLQLGGDVTVLGAAA
ncbi:MAG: hypothetical protein QG597_587 [Actinomycetota bacterium]|nr:hypothetical protein [Actinomycetota bacterium]